MENLTTLQEEERTALTAIDRGLAIHVVVGCLRRYRTAVKTFLEATKDKYISDSDLESAKSALQSTTENIENDPYSEGK